MSTSNNTSLTDSGSSHSRSANFILGLVGTVLAYIALTALRSAVTIPNEVDGGLGIFEKAFYAWLKSAPGTMSVWVFIGAMWQPTNISISQTFIRVIKIFSLLGIVTFALQVLFVLAAQVTGSDILGILVGFIVIGSFFGVRWEFTRNKGKVRISHIISGTSIGGLLAGLGIASIWGLLANNISLAGFGVVGIILLVIALKLNDSTKNIKGTDVSR